MGRGLVSCGFSFIPDSKTKAGLLATKLQETLIMSQQPPRGSVQSAQDAINKGIPLKST